MPIFEYRCKACGHDFELLRFSSDKDGDIECPKCGKKKAERLMSVFGGTSAGSCGSCSSTSCSTSPFS